ncbi:MAG: hypothetical protein ACP6IS_11675 [Candidatus Asgardarchaeia archaeon]
MKRVKYDKWFINRESGFTNIERKRLQEYERIKRNKEPQVIGYVQKVSRDFFFLLPFPWFLQVYILCEYLEYPKPADGSFIFAEGKWKRKILNSIKHPRKGTQIEATYVFEVEQYKEAKDDLIQSYKPSLKFENFRELIFEPWENLPNEIKTFTALDLISTPPLQGTLGGLSEVMLNAGSTRIKSSSFVNFIKSIAIPLIAPQKVIKLENFSLLVRYPVSLKTFNIGYDVSQDVKRYLSRNVRSVTNELSVAVSTRNTVAHVVEKAERGIPFRLSDIPVLMPIDAEYRNISIGPDPDIIEFLEISHMTVPRISDDDFAKAVHYIQNDLLSTISSHTNIIIPVVARLLNLNYFGRPLAAVRIARSIARAYQSKSISYDDIIKTYKEDYSKLISNWLYEIEKAILDAKHFGHPLMHISVLGRKVLNFINKNCPVSRDDIFKHFSNESYAKLTNVLDELANSGLIFIDSNQKYRTIPTDFSKK